MQEKKLWIPPAIFETVVEHTPLVSLDIVATRESSMLVGKRINRPAKGTWFVPGGRICKGETLDEAFARIAKDEVGLDLKRHQCLLLGVFDHFYDDSALDPDSSTHYVVLSYHVPLRGRKIDEEKMKSQHNGFKFLSMHDMIRDDTVHENTKVYARMLKGVYPHKGK